MRRAGKPLIDRLDEVRPIRRLIAASHATLRDAKLAAARLSLSAAGAERLGRRLKVPLRREVLGHRRPA